MILLASVLAILVAWTAIALVLIGIGSVPLKLFANSCSLVDSFWVGLAVSVAFLELWNLLLPVSSVAGLVLVCAGLLGLLVNRAFLLARLKSASQPNRWLIASCLGLAALIALRASGPCEHYDTGLYGASAVRWILTYPAVPGLANLHGRLGFNSSVFLCLAALRQGLWKDFEYHLFDGLLLAGIWFTILPACFRLARGLPNAPSDWFHCILAIPMFFWTTRAKIVGTLTDEPATIVCLVATGIVFDELHWKSGATDREAGLARLFVATSLYSLAVAFKESTLVFAALGWLIAFVLAYSQARSEPHAPFPIAAILAVSVLIVVPWLARGIILSGYPFYPSTAFAFPLDWRVPFAAAHHDFAWVQSWGRIPDAPLSDTRGFAWLPVWLNRSLRNRSAFQVPLLIAAFGAAFGIAAARVFRVREKLPSLSTGWLLIPSLAAIIFWSFAAPDPRFAQFAIWTLAGVIGAWGITAAGFRFGAGRSNRVALAALFALLLWCQISVGWRESLQSISARNPIAPLPSVTVLPRQTQSSLTVYAPAAGNQCWDAPLPCTPEFDPSLRLRDGQSIQHGFFSDGRVD